MGLERNLKILKDVIDVMGQTKRSTEDITHPNVSFKRFKEMVKAPKEKKKIEGKGLDSKTFQFLEIPILIRW
jgi:hypothetical protein